MEGGRECDMTQSVYRVIDYYIHWARLKCPEVCYFKDC